jgi:hypothetical protein
MNLHQGNLKTLTNQSFVFSSNDFISCALDLRKGKYLGLPSMIGREFPINAMIFLTLLPPILI